MSYKGWLSLSQLSAVFYAFIISIDNDNCIINLVDLQ